MNLPIFKLLKRKPDLAARWPDFFPPVDPETEVEAEPEHNFDELQKDLATAHWREQWTPAGRLVLTMEIDASMVTAIDRLADQHRLAGRLEVIQAALQLLKRLSTRSTYNDVSDTTIHPRSE